MKKLVTVAACVAFVSMAGVASATTYVEQFYGSANDNNYVELWEGNATSLEFNLNELNAWYFNPDPTLDAEGYDASSMSIISSNLEFTFSSDDNPDETVQIKAGYWDGNDLIKEVTYDLGNYTPGYWTWKTETYESCTGILWWKKCEDKTRQVHDEWINSVSEREYATLEIDLFSEGFGGYLQDGLFDTIVLSPWMCGDNDIRLDFASLTAETSEVPEPGTMLLMGAGLAGLVGFGRKRRIIKN